MNMEDNLQTSPDNSTNADSGGGTDEFFDALDRSVNSAVMDETEGTSQQEQVTQFVQQELPSDSDKKEVDYEKRYKDSSREALKQRETLNQYEPFFPILDAMKNDPDLVGVVRDHLVNGTAPKNMKEQLGLDEDFVFDSDEAMNDPESDSAKVFGTTVDRIVQKRLGDAQQQQQQQIAVAKKQQVMGQEKEAFMKAHNMSEDEFAAMSEAAKTRTLTLEDIHYILNRDKTRQNIDANARNDMLTQMKGVRNIPTSAASTNNSAQPSTETDTVFNALLGQDGQLDDLFG